MILQGAPHLGVAQVWSAGFVKSYGCFSSGTKAEDSHTVVAFGDDIPGNA